LFFVLSAFLLGRPFLLAESTPPRYGRFLLDRFLRIAPAYYVALALAVLAVRLGFPGNWRPVQLGWNAAFLANYDVDSIFSFNPVLWTLAVEVQFYLLLPWMARAFRSRWWPLSLAVCFLVSILFRGLAFHDGSPRLNFMGTFWLPAFLGHFGVGLAASRIRKVPRPGWFVPLGLLLVLAPVLLWIPPGSTSLGSESLGGQVLVRPLAAVGFAVLVLAAASPGAFARLLRWRPLTLLGDMSYSLYLVHLPVLITLWRFVPATRHPYLFSVGVVVFSCLAAAALYWGVELPAERWRHRRKAAARAVPPSTP
jgi:peptidoglycan/LPS O-acetylase OafA/YrhL